MRTIAEFTDPRLVAIYDTANAYAPDTQSRFYSHTAKDQHAGIVVDLGCGTGLITCALAEQGLRVIGIDPAPAMVEIARRRPFGDRVHWIVGEVDRLGRPGADLAIMTGHVAQFFLTDRSWRDALARLHAALRPGGRLAFESRNPSAREWEGWTPRASRSVEDPNAGQIEIWSEIHQVRGGIVSYAIHYVFARTGDEVVSPISLRFRTAAELTQSLAAAGFEVEHIFGDWGRHPVEPRSRELIVVASR